MKPSVSVLMPAYNADKFIGEAIDSILNQTLSDFEFIIINDGSADGTAQIIQSYNDPRIRYFANDGNLGIARTYNLAIDLADGEYLAIAEHDDISHPRRLEISRDYLIRHPEIGVMSGQLARFKTTPPPKFKRIGTPSVAADWMASRCAPVFGTSLTRHASQMMRASVLKKYNAKYETQYKICCDLSLILQLLPHVKMSTLRPRLTAYRAHAGNVSNNLETVYTEANDLLNRYLKGQFNIDSDLAFWNFRAVNNEEFDGAVDKIQKILKTVSTHPDYDSAVLQRYAGDGVYRIFQSMYKSGRSHQEIFNIYKKTPLMRHAHFLKICDVYLKYFANKLHLGGGGNLNDRTCITHWQFGVYWQLHRGISFGGN